MRCISKLLDLQYDEAEFTQCFSAPRCLNDGCTDESSCVEVHCVKCLLKQLKSNWHEKLKVTTGGCLPMTHASTIKYYLSL